MYNAYLLLVLFRDRVPLTENHPLSLLLVGWFIYIMVPSVIIHHISLSIHLL